MEHMAMTSPLKNHTVRLGEGITNSATRQHASLGHSISQHAMGLMEFILLPIYHEGKKAVCSLGNQWGGGGGGQGLTCYLC